jgi:transposase
LPSHPQQRLRPPQAGWLRNSSGANRRKLDVRIGSFASILVCPHHVRPGGNFGNAGCPVFAGRRHRLGRDSSTQTGASTSKIHAVVDTNGLPVHLALTPGEAHDNRLCSGLLGALLPQTMLLADRGYDADWIRELARQQGAGPISHRSTIAKAPFVLTRICTARATCRQLSGLHQALASIPAACQ